MIFNATPLAGACTVDVEPRGDARGFFARVFCEKEFLAAGLESRFVQVNDSLSTRLGTLRGMHYQLPPAAEVKVVRCVKGRLFDVIVDLRPDSTTFKRWYGSELSAENRRMMYVPRGFAHGFITLEEDTEAIYLVSGFHSQQNERGIRYNDPAIGIAWPAQPVEVSDKDSKAPSFDFEHHGIERMRGLK